MSGGGDFLASLGYFAAAGAVSVRNRVNAKFSDPYYFISLQRIKCSMSHVYRMATKKYVDACMLMTQEQRENITYKEVLECKAEAYMTTINSYSGTEKNGLDLVEQQIVQTKGMPAFFYVAYRLSPWNNGCDEIQKEMWFKNPKIYNDENDIDKTYQVLTAEEVLVGRMTEAYAVFNIARDFVDDKKRSRSTGNLIGCCYEEIVSAAQEVAEAMNPNFKCRYDIKCPDIFTGELTLDYEYLLCKHYGLKKPIRSPIKVEDCVRDSNLSLAETSVQININPYTKSGDYRTRYFYTKDYKNSKTPDDVLKYLILQIALRFHHECTKDFHFNDFRSHNAKINTEYVAYNLSARYTWDNLLGRYGHDQYSKYIIFDSNDEIEKLFVQLEDEFNANKGFDLDRCVEILTPHIKFISPFVYGECIYDIRPLLNGEADRIKHYLLSGSFRDEICKGESGYYITLNGRKVTWEDLGKTCFKTLEEATNALNDIYSKR